MCKFKVGQKVVFISNGVPNDNCCTPKKDEVVTVGAICNVYPDHYDIVEYPRCKNGLLQSMAGRHFAPIEPRRVEISIGIAYPETEDRLDAVKTSEPCTQ